VEPPNETAKKKVHHRSSGDVELHGSGLVAWSPMVGDASSGNLPSHGYLCGSWAQKFVQFWGYICALGHPFEVC